MRLVDSLPASQFVVVYLIGLLAIFMLLRMSLSAYDLVKPWLWLERVVVESQRLGGQF